MQFGFFGFFAKALLLAMNWLHDVTKLGYGWVIVLFTVIIKIGVLAVDGGEHALDETDAGARAGSEGAQGKIQGRPAKVHAKAVELWKKNKVSPMGGCLPMLIQTPVFIGFFTMIRSAIELRGAHFLWVADLSKPDTLFMIPGINFIPFNSTPGGAVA
jgi:YidC/Oxa1 family membrane protein insertase